MFSKLEIRKKKRDFLSEKRESGMTLKKREFTPENGSVDTYVIDPPYAGPSKQAACSGARRFAKLVKVGNYTVLTPKQ